MLKHIQKLGLAAAMVAATLSAAGIGAAKPPVAAAPVTATAPAVAKPAADANNPLLAVDGGPAVAIDPKVGQPVDGYISTQAQFTPTGERAKWMHDTVLVWIIGVISAFVLGLLLWVIVRYNRAANPVPSKTSHNTLIEVVWTLVPVIILIAIAIPSIGLLQAQYRPAPANAITLKAIGNQWFWNYQYPDNGGFELTSNLLKDKGDAAAGERVRTDADGPPLLATDQRVVLPVGVPVRLITTSNDVIHSWAMPAFWVKLDAVPGKINETSFTIEKPGVYFGQCSELCGARHGYMPITVVAVDKPTFDKWVIAKGGSVKGAAPAAAAAIPATATAPAAASGK